jgi:tryptophan synthase beta chain
MVRDFQSVIGRETRKQCMEQFGGKPDILVACIKRPTQSASSTSL